MFNFCFGNVNTAGYRLYDKNALQDLQQILFFRELGFALKDIIKIMQNPDFDRISAYKKQKELLLLKRNRTDRLIHLLERLEKGEPCMSFKEFDLSEYIHALEDFKANQADVIIKYWGSVEHFSEMTTCKPALLVMCAARRTKNPLKIHKTSRGFSIHLLLSNLNRINLYAWSHCRSQGYAL